MEEAALSMLLAIGLLALGSGHLSKRRIGGRLSTDRSRRGLSERTSSRLQASSAVLMVVRVLISPKIIHSSKFGVLRDLSQRSGICFSLVGSDLVSKKRASMLQQSPNNVLLDLIGQIQVGPRLVLIHKIGNGEDKVVHVGQGLGTVALERDADDSRVQPNIHNGSVLGGSLHHLSSLVRLILTSSVAENVEPSRR